MQLMHLMNVNVQLLRVLVVSMLRKNYHCQAQFTDLLLFYAQDSRHSVLGQHAISWNTSTGDKMTKQTAKQKACCSDPLSQHPVVFPAYRPADQDDNVLSKGDTNTCLSVGA